MVFSTVHQLDLPDDFPAEEMVAFMAAARSVMLVPTKSEAWTELGGASNLIGWRFRACHEDMRRYIESWREFGNNVSFEEIYLREKALFGMFTAGVSCIESACYALYALVSHPKLLALPFGEKEQLNCSPAELSKRLANFPDAKALTAVLNLLKTSSEWKLWMALRNRMTHRSNLPRFIYGTVGSEPARMNAQYFSATSSTPAFVAGISEHQEMYFWLSNSLRTLLVEGCSLAIALECNNNIRTR